MRKESANTRAFGKDGKQPGKDVVRSSQKAADSRREFAAMQGTAAPRSFAAIARLAPEEVGRGEKNSNPLLPLQRKLAVGVADDPLEADADAAADRVMRGEPAPACRSGSPAVRRKCACDGSGKPCRECEEEKGKVQRKATAPVTPVEAPPLVRDVLGSPGQALDPETRSFMEPRFGHELSRVRVHTDARAAESAKSVNALTYTVGDNVVFGEGQYAPGSIQGKHLLAHELSHVVQQRGEPAIVQRSVISAIGDFFSGIGNGIANVVTGIGKGIARLLGSENYSQEELQAYLKKLDEGKPEGAYDSDNKARAVTNAWRLGGSPYVLTAQRKALMIRDMQQGYTGTDDERAILELLERSYNSELSYIFGAGGITAVGLNSDIDGYEFERLKDFYERRFDGGMEALLKVSVKPIGYPVPLGSALPQPGDAGISTEDLKGANPRWNEECITGILCTQDESVVAALPGLTVLKTPAVTEYYWVYDGATWTLKTKDHAAFSNAKKKIIGFKLDEDCGSAAAAVVHEVRHQQQPQNWTILEKEKDAYTFEENWEIQRGIPGRPDFRMPKPDGGEQVNQPAVEQYVTKRYSGVTATAGESITGHTPAGKTEVTKSDGSAYTREPQKGDNHQDAQRTDQALSNAPKADATKWVCPKKK